MGESPDRKTRIEGNRVIHTPKGTLHHDDFNSPPFGLTEEQWEERRRGSKIDERQVLEDAHDGLRGKQQIERLDGDRDEVAETRKGGRRSSD